jgi:hypothetical protein
MEPDDELDSLQATDPVESRELWDKRPDETAKAFGAFVLYRDAERRSFKIVGDQLNCSPQNIYQWSSRFDWRGRCDAFDIEQDRIQRAELSRGRVRMRERHLQVAKAMLGVAAYGLKEWQGRVEQKLPLHLEPEQIAMLVKTAVELENRTVGSETDAGRFTQIIVNLGDAPDDPDEADVPLLELEAEYEPPKRKFNKFN